MQLGHAGAKGSTRVPWEGEDLPLPADNWPLISASPLQYLDGVSDWSRAMTRDDMDRVLDDFVRATRWSAEAGFDWLELHCAHGYLLSSFISPLTNLRTDEYGGSLGNRLRYPLEVFAAMRVAWPSGLPMSVRISAHDWVEGGITADDAVEIARSVQGRRRRRHRLLVWAGQQEAEAGLRADVPDAVFRPDTQRGRRPDDRVGAISEADHVNSIIAAGRADLCAIARPHLANPAWTLTEAAKIGYLDLAWPKQYRAAKMQLERNLERERAGRGAIRRPLAPGASQSRDGCLTHRARKDRS
jgi:anthraniloyl-CoA monooxygenase